MNFIFRVITLTNEEYSRIKLSQKSIAANVGNWEHTWQHAYPERPRLQTVEEHFTTTSYTTDQFERLCDYPVAGNRPHVSNMSRRGKRFTHFAALLRRILRRTNKTQISRKSTHKSHCSNLLRGTPCRHCLNPLSFYLEGPSVSGIRGSFSTLTSHGLIESKSKGVRTTHRVNTLYTFTIYTRLSLQCQTNNQKKSPFWRKRKASQSRMTCLPTKIVTRRNLIAFPKSSLLFLSGRDSHHNSNFDCHFEDPHDKYKWRTPKQ